MKPRSKLIAVRLLVPGAFLAFALWGYELAVGFPRFIDGKLVHRHTSWYGRNYPWGIPPYRGLMYYYYSDAHGGEVRHGPLREMHSNGVVKTKAFFRDGVPEGAWTEWDDKGEKLWEQICRDGKVISEFNARKIDAILKPSKDPP